MTVAGTWRISMNTPIGTQSFSWQLQEDGGQWQGIMQGPTGDSKLTDVQVAGSDVSFKTVVASPMGSLDLGFSAAVSGDTISGVCKTRFGDQKFSGMRA